MPNMFNILSSTVMEKPGWLAGTFMDLGRSLLAFIDGIGYNILAFIYNIFYSVASAEILSSQTIVAFYQRVQLIIGVFMMFKLALSLINVIINPDTIKDNNKGLSKIVSRVVVSLFLLLLIIPIGNTDDLDSMDSDSLESRIASNGILFGYLYQFQDSVMTENIIGKLVLGTAATTSDSIEAYEINPGESMITTVARAFVQPAVVYNDRPFCLSPSDENYDANDPCPNVACPTEVAQSGYLDDGKFNGFTTMNVVNKTCKLTDKHYNSETGESYAGREVYAFNYIPFAGLVCSVVMIIIILGFTVDIAIRSIKLAFLRLIAPIPIISYIDPKGKDEGAFNNWVKILTSTYLDLFIRLLIVYFGAFCIQQIATGAFDLGDAFSIGTIEGLFAMVFLIIGILFFMKQAPSFLRAALGLKNNPMSNIGLSGILGGAGALAGGAGLSGAGAAMLQNADRASEAAAQGKPAGPMWSAGRDFAAQLRTGDPKTRGGMINRAIDNLSRHSAVGIARRDYGVTAAGLAVADENVKEDKKRAAASQDLYNRFLNGHVTQQELQTWASDNNGTYDTTTGMYTDANGNTISMREALYNKQASDAKAAAKSEKNYEEAKKFASSHRINPSFEEEHHRSFFGEKSQAERTDMYNARGRGKTAHQTVADRLFGSYKKWDEPSSGRTENRWNPRGDRENIDNSTLHDDPMAPPDPGQGPGGPWPGGPGPGGGPPPGRP